MRCDLARDRRGALLDVGLPVAKHQPALALERGGDTSIAFDVGRDLRDPVRRVVPGRELREPMIEIATMPVVSVAEHDDAGGAEDDVRPAHKIGDIEAVPQAEHGERLAED